METVDPRSPLVSWFYAFRLCRTLTRLTVASEFVRIDGL